MNISRDFGDIAVAVGEGHFELCSLEQADIPGHYLPMIQAWLPAYFNKSSSLTDPLPFSASVECLTSLDFTKEQAQTRLLEKCAELANQYLAEKLLTEGKQSPKSGEEKSKKEALEQGDFTVKSFEIEGTTLVPRIVLHYRNGSFIKNSEVIRHIEMSWKEVSDLYIMQEENKSKKLLSPRVRRKKCVESKELRSLSNQISKKINEILEEVTRNHFEKRMAEEEANKPKEVIDPHFTAYSQKPVMTEYKVPQKSIANSFDWNEGI